MNQGQVPPREIRGVPQAVPRSAGSTSLLGGFGETAEADTSRHDGSDFLRHQSDDPCDVRSP